MTLRSEIGNIGKPGWLNEHGFSLLRRLAAALAHDPEDADAREVVLRLLDRREDLGTSAPILDGLVERLGLYPYLDPQQLGTASLVAYESNRPSELNDYVFHRAQSQVYRYLLEGDNVILSAPTSFGKSLIIDAVVATEQFDNLVIVVPTIALIDETRRRLSAFSDRYRLITHLSQGQGAKNVFVLTQERALDLLSRSDLQVDFFVIDEFYKLQLRPEDQQRALLLNQAFYRLHRTGAQFYLLGPNVEGLVEMLPERLNARFIRTDYATVAVDVRRVRTQGRQDLSVLADLCKELEGPTIIYCKSPGRVRDVVNALADADVGIGLADNGVANAADWLSKHYHSGWHVVRGLRAGVGAHHGRVPRAVGQYIVRLFNQEALKFLVCTSTLIEGVNTKAKNVVVFDNKIARKKFDYFTFSNIRGRSGRMFEHFIGRVYVFHDPPREELPLVDVPIYSEPSDMPSSLLIQLDEDDASEEVLDRLRKYREQELLSLETLRRNTAVDPDEQLAFAKELSEDPARASRLLGWRGVPSQRVLKELLEWLWDSFSMLSPSQGCKSAAQLAKRLSLLKDKSSARALIEEEIRFAQKADESVDNVLDFLKNWVGFRVPMALRVSDVIQQELMPQLGFREGDFDAYAGLVESQFQPAALLALDEYGLPLELGVRLKQYLHPEDGIDAALGRLARLRPQQLRGLTAFEKEVLKFAREGLVAHNG